MSTKTTKTKSSIKMAKKVQIASRTLGTLSFCRKILRTKFHLLSLQLGKNGENR